MGTMSFLTPLKLSAEAARELERACIAGGPDSMPWPTRALYEPGRLTVHRDNASVFQEIRDGRAVASGRGAGPGSAAPGSAAGPGGGAGFAAIGATSA